MQSKGIIGTDYVNGFNNGQDNVEILKNLQERDNAGWIMQIILTITKFFQN
jgi:hypothetical protein